MTNCLDLYSVPDEECPMVHKWYYSQKGQPVAGPCSSMDLRRLATRGQLTPDDLVGRNRMVRLVKAGSVKGLFNVPTS